MEDRIPLIVYGDGPRLPSGLGRIARDLILHLQREQDTLGIDIHQLGVDPPDGWHWQAWPFWGFQPDMRDQGRGPLQRILEDFSEAYTQPPVVFMIMDPSRCYDLTRLEEGKGLAAQFWGYFPLDSENIQGRIGGPAAEAVWSCQRVLGYGRYGARVLQATLAHVAQEKLGERTPKDRIQVPRVSYLPHGIDDRWHPGVGLNEAGEQFAQWKLGLPGDAWVIGAVATNQPRKDLSLLFSSAAMLKRKGLKVGVWLHTDRLTNAWDVGQLCLDYGFARGEVCVSLADTILTDTQLAARYNASDVTLGVGLGEGFGYPLVESVACGTPVVHVEFGGGVELIAHPHWTVPPVAWRVESAYGVKRPVLKPEDVAAALAQAGFWKRNQRALCEAYCSGAVAHLRWEVLWPAWRRWIVQGLEQIRGGAA